MHRTAKRVARIFFISGLLALLIAGGLIAGMAFNLASAWSQELAYETPRGIGHLDADVAHARSVAGNLVIIDVRTPREWEKTGTPVGALRIPLPVTKPFTGLEEFVNNVEKATGGNRIRAVALICTKGGRSSIAFHELKRRGYQNIFNIAEGMRGGWFGPGWIKRGLPLSPCNTCTPSVEANPESEDG